MARARAVGAEDKMIQSRRIARPDECGRGRVAKQRAHRPVVGMDEFRIVVAGEDETAFRHAAADQRAREPQRVEVA